MNNRQLLQRDLDETIELLCDSERDDHADLLVRLEIVWIVLSEELWIIDGDGEVEQFAASILDAESKLLAQLHAGKEKARKGLFGRAMQAGRGRIDAADLQPVFDRLLDERLSAMDKQEQPA